MKFQLKLKKLTQKPDDAETIMSAQLKKAIKWLKANPNTPVPFCYGVDFFGEGRPLLTLCEAKEIDKHFKQKRVKGQGFDENGKVIKVDKKKSACGTVMVKDDIFEFCYSHGLMKTMEVKNVFKAIPIVKKEIGQDYTIIKGEMASGEDAEEVSDETTETSTGDNTTDTPTNESSSAPSEESSSAPVDGQAIGAEFTQIQNGYKQIESLKGAEKAKMILTVYKKLELFMPKLAEYTAQATGKAQEQANQMTSLAQNYYNKLKGVASQLDQRQSEKSTQQMEALYATIGDTIGKLLSNGEDQLQSIDGLLDALKSLSK